MKATITFEISTPEGVNCTYNELYDWVRYNLGITGHIELTNPLAEYEFVADDLYNVLEIS